MPISAQAMKKMRHDKTVTERKTDQEDVVRAALKKARKSPSKKTVATAFSLLDKASKHHIFHQNKTNRLKARLAKLLVK